MRSFRLRRISWASRLAVLPFAAMLASTAFVSSASAALPTPPTPDLGRSIEVLAPDQPQFFCRSTLQPGVAAFKSLVLATYRGTVSVSDVRSCTSEAGSSEHKDGRAWDWGVGVFNATQKAQGQALLTWLFATDRYGNKFAMARRLGIMYIIWNKQIWGTWSQSWQPYSCSGVTACHQDHMHFSFGWAGAEKKTSYWTHQVSPVLPPPLPVYDSLTAAASPFSMPATAKRVSSPYLLRATHTYSVQVSGVFKYGTASWQQADAACAFRNDGHGWRVVRTITASGIWQWTPTTNTGGGCNTRDHHYLATLVPSTADVLSVGVTDTIRTDNSGALSVSVRRTA